MAIYYYLKNLWDKWLVISNSNAFDVDTFFEKNFVFIDSFYKNVYHLLAINCEQLLKAWTELADNGSIFHFLSRIVSDHGCIFLPVPDYIGFSGGGKEGDLKDIEMMEDLFRPLPYNEMPPPNNSNKFIVMYTHSPSHIKPNDDTYKGDSYDIWVDGRPTEDAEKRFKKSEDDNASKDLVSRFGYNVPSFGVSFARQNNHIFKNLKVSMDNPVMTEQAMKAQWQIALKGSSQTHSVCFIGQDTFNVFSNYSYSVDIEMLGNAQICPLMYFQLNNIPMWRGTYMIYKVIHNMTPGNMTTTVSAMKMNKFAQPFNTSFFSVHKGKGKPKQDENCLSPECCPETNGAVPTINGGVISNPLKISINDDKTTYDLVLWRYAEYSVSGRTGQITDKENRASGNNIDGVIYEYKTNKILCYTIEDSADATANKYYNDIDTEIIPAGNTWPSNGEIHLGQSAYCVSKVSGTESSNFGKKAGDPNTMLGIKVSPGCLFHYGKNIQYSSGCILIGAKSDKGERSFDGSDWHKENIFSSTNENVAYFRKFYDNVVPAICSGKKVVLHIRKQLGVVSSTGATPNNSKPTGKLLSIRDAFISAGFKEGEDFVIRPVYASNVNFYGVLVPGYRSGQNDLYTVKRTLDGLIKVLPLFKKNGWKMCIFDAYRPHRSALAFSEWAKTHKVARGVIAKDGKSAHCHGNAVDLTALDKNNNYVKMIKDGKIVTQWAKQWAGFDDFDGNGNYCADDDRWNKSNTNKLRQIMAKGGFNSLDTEYWHFSIGGKSGEYLDVPY